MKILTTITATFLFSNIFCQAKIEALEKVHHFDTLLQGAPVTHDFKFINTGNEPLIITTAKTSCGCDVANWPKEPIQPGDTASINYKYDSKRLGPINKSMTINSNAVNSPSLVVRTKGLILKKAD